MNVFLVQMTSGCPHAHCLFCSLIGLLHSVFYQLVLSFPKSKVVLFIKEFLSSLLIVTVLLSFFLTCDSG